tara:strand:+ start:97 stop:453 length:357 start_codon:yes stop_codon:yes gene_type:complete
MNLKTVLIQKFQRNFIKIQSLGTHQLNVKGVWKADYKLLYNSVYDALRNKLNHYSECKTDSRIVLPNKLYVDEYKELESKLLSNKNLIDTLNLFFGGRQWKIGSPVCWRLKPLKKNAF